MYKVFKPEKKTEKISLALTQTEWLQLQDGANCMRRNISDYIRQLVLRDYQETIRDPKNGASVSL
jgi:hypothetical protein